MDNESKIHEFYNSKGKTFEEIFDQEGPEMELEPEKIDYWWKHPLRVFRRKQQDTDIDEI